MLKCEWEKKQNQTNAHVEVSVPCQSLTRESRNSSERSGSPSWPIHSTRLIYVYRACSNLRALEFSAKDDEQNDGGGGGQSCKGSPERRRQDCS